MTEDSEILRLKDQVAKLVKQVGELDEEIKRISANSALIRELEERLGEIEYQDFESNLDENDKVTYELLNAIEDMQNVLSKKLDVDFQNKLIGVHINWWANHVRTKIRLE